MRGSSLPLSIIIVGIGDANFSKMDVLDADDKPLYSNKFKKNMESDIVQFVPFNEFKHDPRLLAKETLEEIPRQFLGYMDKHKIVPNKLSHQEQMQIKDSLSKQKSLKPGENKESPDFFACKLENFVKKVKEKHPQHSAASIRDFLAKNGYPVESILDFDTVMKSSSYRNNLLLKQ